MMAGLSGPDEAWGLQPPLPLPLSKAPTKRRKRLPLDENPPAPPPEPSLEPDTGEEAAAGADQALAALAAPTVPSLGASRGRDVLMDLTTPVTAWEGDVEDGTLPPGATDPDATDPDAMRGMPSSREGMADNREGMPATLAEETKSVAEDQSVAEAEGTFLTAGDVSGCSSRAPPEMDGDRGEIGGDRGEIGGARGEIDEIDEIGEIGEIDTLGKMSGDVNHSSAETKWTEVRDAMDDGAFSRPSSRDPNATMTLDELMSAEVRDLGSDLAPDLGSDLGSDLAPGAVDEGTSPSHSPILK